MLATILWGDQEVPVLERGWQGETKATRRRDELNKRAICSSGWTYLAFWECEIGGRTKECVQKIADAIAKCPTIPAVCGNRNQSADRKLKET
jgi:G:T-mismatch repair DNA endonuclease (very short patch repair protein)